MRVALIGTGAQAKYAIDTFKRRDIEIAGAIDLGAPPDRKKCDDLGIPFLGGIELIASLPDHASHVIVCCASNDQKQVLSEQVAQIPLPFASAIHPSAITSETAVLGEGLIINALAVIQPFAKIGNGCMIHATAVIEHDVAVGDYSNIAMGAVLAGWVQVGTLATVFTGSIVAPTVTIGDGAVIGAGSVVLDHVPPGAKVYGSPARSVN